MTTNIEFKKGILFGRLNGSFYNETLNLFESRVIPVILGMSLKRVNIDLKDVNFVDKSGIDSIIKININYILDKNKYEVFLCVVDNKYTKCVSNILNKIFDNKEEAYSYFNELKEINTLEKLGKLI